MQHSANTYTRNRRVSVALMHISCASTWRRKGAKKEKGDILCSGRDGNEKRTAHTLHRILLSLSWKWWSLSPVLVCSTKEMVQDGRHTLHDGISTYIKFRKKTANQMRFLHYTHITLGSPLLTLSMTSVHLLSRSAKHSSALNEAEGSFRTTNT